MIVAWAVEEQTIRHGHAPGVQHIAENLTHNLANIGSVEFPLNFRIDVVGVSYLCRIGSLHRNMRMLDVGPTPDCPLNCRCSLPDSSCCRVVSKYKYRC
jgi:hypothetical protein